MHVKKIPIKNNNELEVTLTDEFMVQLRDLISLPEGQEVTDDHLINFFYYSLKNAIDKEALSGQK